MRRVFPVIAALLLSALFVSRLISAQPSLAAPPKVPSLGGTPTTAATSEPTETPTEIATPAASETASVSGTPSTSVLDANKSLVRRMIEQVYNAHDLNAVGTFYSTDYVEHVSSTGQPTDLKTFKTDTQSLFTAFPDLAYTVQDIAADGDKVWVLSQVCGTQTGPLAAIAPTNKHVCIDAVDIVRIENNLIVEHWGVSDNLSLLEQLGVIPTGS